MNRIDFGSVLAVCLLLAVGRVTVHSQDAATGPPRWYDAIGLSGFVSAGYQYNSNQPISRTNQFRIFDTDDNSFRVDVLELALQKSATAAGEAGFCFHLAAGSSLPKVTRSSGLNTGDIDVHQMFVRYVAGIGNGLTLDAGKFVTPLGYELIDGYDGYNDNATRSFLFGYAIPFTHTGLRVVYPFGAGLTATAIVTNGWDNAIDNNRAKSVVGQLACVPTDGMLITAGCAYGAERSADDRDARTVIDLCGSYAVAGYLTVGFNGDYGTEEGIAADGGSAVWSGAAVYLRCNVSESLSLTLRGEHFEDLDGVRTGTVQKLREVTLTPEFRPAKGLVLRGDMRIDASSANVFEKESGFSDTQVTVGVNVLVIF